ncbi:MAG: enolase C-terminal domain-like protein [Kiritimatiellae bacterium]|nr:enolase C-terminal domain-like protein [Kiritimatiellia bacterium]
MKITGVQIDTVCVPFLKPIRWAWGTGFETRRNIIRIHTDAGIIGLGETKGSEVVKSLLKSMETHLLGADPFEIETFLRKTRIAPYFTGYSAFCAFGGLEMALWDLMGKAVDLPVYKLLGGKCRSAIEFSGYVFPQYDGDSAADESSAPEEIARFCVESVKAYGFRTLKLKGGIFSPDTDIKTIARIRDMLGNKVKLRIDPNGAWKPQTALRACRLMEKYDLEWFEDPTWGIENMRRLRKDLHTPLATNMCIVDFDQLPIGIRLEAVDIVLGDIHKWGGIKATQKLAAVCSVFGLGMTIHSGAELGISTAANLHVTAATPKIEFPIDTHYIHYKDDIIKGGRFQIKDGCMKIPDGPGLGVEIDEEKLKQFGNLSHNKQKPGEMSAVFDQTRRPDWVPEPMIW